MTASGMDAADSTACAKAGKGPSGAVEEQGLGSPEAELLAGGGR